METATPPTLPLRSHCEMGPVNLLSDLEIKLPENINLLSSQEILDMINRHRGQLQLYIARLNPLVLIKEEVIALKEKLNHLEIRFTNLENDKLALQDSIAELVILESEYAKNFQDLQSLIKDNFAEPVLKRKLEARIRELELQSENVELNAKKELELDNFVNNYMALRQEYHLHKEKLLTWKSQGNLRT